MPTPDRIQSMYQVTAMVALDTVDYLAERVMNLLASGRRMTICERYTYRNEPPEVRPGLTLDGDPKLWKQTDQAGFTVRLKPGALTQFGFVADASHGSATESAAWNRFHASEADGPIWARRRRNVTRVDIVGGLRPDEPSRDDGLIISYWNGDGVCAETVVGFDYETRLGAPPVVHEHTRHFTASAVVVDPNRRLVLLVDHLAEGRRRFPGGHIDPDETGDEAAVREVLEETGVHATIWQPPGAVTLPYGTVRPAPLMVAEFPAPPKPHKGEPAHSHIDFLYVATADSTEPVTPRAGEVTAAVWVPIDTLDAARVRPDVPVAARAALDYLGSRIYAEAVKIAGLTVDQVVDAVNRGIRDLPPVTGGDRG